MKHKRWTWIAVLGVALLLLGWGGAQAAGRAASAGQGAQGASWAPEAPPEPGLHLLASGETGVVLELVTPAFQVRERTVDGVPCQELTVADYAASDRPGRPLLPRHGTMIGIPLQATVTVTILEDDAVALPGRYDLCPAPRPIGGPDPMGEIALHEQQVPARDVEAYGGKEPYPAGSVEIVSTGMVRSQRVAQIAFHPFRYNPRSGEVWHSRRIRVQLDFQDGHNQVSRSGPGVAEGSFEGILESALVNYDVARQWRVLPQARSDRLAGPEQSVPAWKLVVNQDGLYQVTRGDLEGAGAVLDGVDPRTFRLQNRGQEVAIYVAGEEDGSFDPQDYVLFYGQKTNTKYTDANVYWLTWGGVAGQRMATRSGVPDGSASVSPAYWHTVRVEQDVMYNSKTPQGENQDHWLWNYVYAINVPASKDYAIPLDEISTIPFSATVQGALAGYQTYPAVDPDHHTQIYLNGHLVDDATWDGQTEYRFEVQVPQSYLVGGNNTLTVRCPLDLGLPYDAVYANRFAIGYQRHHVAAGDLLGFGNASAGQWAYHLEGFTADNVEVLDVTDPAAVVRIAGGIMNAGVYEFEDIIGQPTEYLALTTDRRLAPAGIVLDNPSDLHSAANGADYIIISHGDLITEVLPLASYRAAQGLRTMVVDVQDVYDEFASGVFDPLAIRDFLAHAYASWVPPAPAYVLLVGDGSLDFKDHMGTGYPNLIPPYLAAVDPWINETATDNRYVCVSGQDTFPDMHIGRLPANNPAEAAAMVAKILGYEQNPPPGDWNQEVLFVADNLDTAGDFAGFSDAIADHWLPSPYAAEKVYLGVTHATSGEVRTALIDAINQGRLLVNYVGHASYQWWATEQILRVDDIASLANGKLPFMVPMTCYEGFFHAPGIPSLGESVVRAAGKGAIASWSPTGLGVAMGHDYLNSGLYDALFSDDVTQLGPATTQAKLYLYSHTAGYRELLDTYVLFGDPALRLNVLDAELGIDKTVTPSTPVQPTDPLTFTLTITSQGPATAHGVVITDLLPAFVANPQLVSANVGLAQRPGAPFAWDVADLAAGQVAHIVVRGTVDGAAGIGSFENRAQVTTTSQEAGSLPNEAGASVLVVAGPPGEVQVSAIPVEIPVGGYRAIVRARVTDLWGNAVADGTPVQFETSLGSLEPASTTTTAGLASTILTSGEVTGTATITATAGTVQGTVQVVFTPKSLFHLLLPRIFKGATY